MNELGCPHLDSPLKKTHQTKNLDTANSFSKNRASGKKQGTTVGLFFFYLMSRSVSSGKATVVILPGKEILALKRKWASVVFNSSDLSLPGSLSAAEGTHGGNRLL